MELTAFSQFQFIFKFRVIHVRNVHQHMIGLPFWIPIEFTVAR
jgi:hypothetical protein